MTHRQLNNVYYQLGLSHRDKHTIITPSYVLKVNV